jgi:hypothetical protein
VFDLHPLHVGEGAVLRAHSRLMAGATVGAYSTLLEHTLVVSGEITPPGSVWQGWPAGPSSLPTASEDGRDLQWARRRLSRGQILWARLFRNSKGSRSHSDVTELLLGHEVGVAEEEELAPAESEDVSWQWSVREAAAAREGDGTSLF